MKDPFTQVYDTIVKELRARYPNVISWNSSKNPKPDVLPAANTPEIQVVLETAGGNLGAKSCGSDIILSFQILLQTEDNILGNQCLPIAWSLIGAYLALKYTALDALQYNGHSFVTDVNIGTATFILGAAERGLIGWACLWPITVYINIPGEDYETIG